MIINGWNNIALNTAPDSANEIHGDRVAKEHGFRGGLVPGVTISAYLIHPGVEAWGEDFLNRGFAHVRVGSPLYDEESFRVSILEQGDSEYRAEITQPDGKVSATAKVSLPEVVPVAPVRRGDPIAEEDTYEPPVASPETFEALRANGCMAFRYHWGSEHNVQSYVRDTSALPDLHKLDGAGFADMGFLLGCSNWVLASNAYMNPWVHLETRSQNHRAVTPDTTIVAEMAVLDLYDKKGHKFVDVDVRLFDEANDTCLSSISLRAIYRLRGL